MVLNKNQLFEFLEEKTSLYNNPSFIESDPVQIPHSFSKKEDVEISAFLTAAIAWGQRKTIIKNAFSLMKLMDDAPSDFIRNAKPNDLERFSIFVHRTFNGIDCIYFMRSLQNIYLNHGGLKSVFSIKKNIPDSLMFFRKVFFELPGNERTFKHISNIEKGASAKRLNLFLKWMVRNDKRGVDFGIWDTISPADLYIPLDVHSGRVSRKLGLITRKQNDWKTVCELTDSLKTLDSNDPVKYDFALFGLGIFEQF